MFKGFFNRLYQGNPNKADLKAEDMPKNRFQLFFAVLGTRFLDLFKINLLFFLFVLPTVIWLVWTAFAILSLPAQETAGAYLNELLNTLQTTLLGLIPCLVLAGPPLAGLTNVIRKWAKDEHAWLWQDFKAGMKENWKQSMLFMFIYSLIMAACMVSVRVYGAMAETQSAFTVLQVLVGVMFAIITMAYLYIFPMMVSYKLKFFPILKNSFLLALGRLPLSIVFCLLTLFPAALGLVIFLFTASYIPMVVVAVYYIIYGASLAVYVNCSYANASFDKFMPASPEAPKKDDEDDDLSEDDAE
ncbi:MAG: DUF624 domain-containing protein [Eubacteriales bacterium]|nr:DUF624 domain-containing protein [Eubacteriales bacterium]